MKKKPTTVRQRRPRPFDSSYQPNKRDMEQEIDMPGTDVKTLKRAFFSRSRDRRKGG